MATVFKAKVIKPQKLKVKAIQDTVLAELEAVAKEVLGDFQSTTKTWKRKPKFESLVEVGSRGPEMLVGTDDEIYTYVNEGTKPHVITPRRARILAFPSEYTAKTKPGFIGSSSGGPGGEILFRPRVMHPGTKAREFDKAISKKWDKLFKRRMEKALKAGVKASGHAI